MFKRSLVFFIVLLLAGIAVALPHNKAIKQPVVQHQLKIDSTKVNIRQFDTAAIKAYRNDPAFNYVKVKTGITFWDRFWAWVWYLWESFWRWIAHLIEKLFGNASTGEHGASALKLLIIGLAVGLIVYVVFKLFGVDILKLFRKNKNDIEIPYAESLENIHQIDFDEAIENARSIKNYRLAVRLLYLRCLKQLSDKDLINWKIDKTNTAYLNELTDAGHRSQFSIVTRQFEYVWYGDFPVDEKSFRSINTIFQEFKQVLS